MAAQDVFGIVGTTQAGNLHIERVVAEGGFGVVYRAHHGGFRAPVAVKCLKIPEQMSKQQRDIFLEKFREEAELMFRLSATIVEVCRPLHVDVLLLGDGRFVPFLAMEWLEGESLDGIITRRREQGLLPLGLHKVVKMMRPVAAALAKAHRFPGPDGAVAIIHRDLKPENLMVATLGGTESMKILDFGIAKAKRAASQAAGRVTGRTLAEDETASFTPAYGAPEQWVPKSWGETGPWTDVWGLALTMVEALCGVPPIDGEPWAMRRVCLDDKRRPTPRNQGAEVPLGVERAFEQALALDPRQRFKTIEAFWSELEKAMGMPPSLGPRDDRCEPGESGESGEKAAAPPPRAFKGERLARIELQKINVQAAQAARAASPPVAPVPTDAAPTDTPPAPPAPKPLVTVGAPPPHPLATVGAPPPNPLVASHPAGSWEFDLTGAHDAPSPPSPRSLEMRLPSRSDPPPPASSSRGASLEMSLPTRSEPPPAWSATPNAPPPSARRPAPAPAPAPTPARSTAFDDGPVAFDLNVPERLHAAPPPPAATPERGAPKLPAPAFDLAPGVRRTELGGTLAPRRHVAEGSELRDRLRAPLGVLLLALALASVEIGFHRVTGGDLALGPVRPFWFAAPLALFGVGFTLYRLMEDRSDE